MGEWIDCLFWNQFDDWLTDWLIRSIWPKPRCWLLSMIHHIWQTVPPRVYLVYRWANSRLMNSQYLAWAEQVKRRSFIAHQRPHTWTRSRQKKEALKPSADNSSDCKKKGEIWLPRCPSEHMASLVSIQFNYITFELDRAFLLDLQLPAGSKKERWCRNRCCCCSNDDNQEGGKICANWVSTDFGLESK